MFHYPIVNAAVSFFLCAILNGIVVAPVSAQFKFSDVTEQVGLKGLSGGTAAWTDFDRDGWVDFYCGGQLWRNVKGQKFERKQSGISGDGIWGDFDNDGFADLFTFSGKGMLYKNQAGKSLQRVEGAIPELPMKVSLGAAWLDIDNDGDLDLYVGGYEIWQQANYLDAILENKDGKFVEIWRQKTVRTARGITTCDYDEDGDTDVYVSNYRLFPNLLWQNDGTGKFKEVAAATGTAGDGGLGAWGHTIGSAWGDLDNDGHFDLFVGNFSHKPDYQDRPKFLKNLGKDQEFRFADKSPDAGLQWQESFASPALADIDNDGDLDLFFTTVYTGDKSVLYRNEGEWKFKNISEGSNVQTAGTYQAAFADFDNDGHVDLLSGGRLFKNPGGKNHWLKIKIRGPNQPMKQRVNRSAIGTQVRIKIGSKIISRQITSATGQGNQNEPTMHFGLGDDQGDLEIQVRWPGGKTQTLKSKPNRTIEISFEPQKQPAKAQDRSQAQR